MMRWSHDASMPRQVGFEPMAHGNHSEPDGIMASLSDSELNNLSTLNYIVSTFSLIGSLCIIVTFLRSETLKKKLAFRLVFCLAIGDFMFAFSNLLGRPSDGSARCYFQAYFVSYFTLASVLWTTCISYSLYVAIHHAHKRALGLTKTMRTFHMYSWGLPLVLTLLPEATSSYGDAGGAFCWIKEDTAGNFWRFAQYYAPLWSAMFYNMKVYLKATSTINKAVSQGILPAGDHSRRGKTLLAYPLVLVVCWTFGSINRIQNWISPESPQYWLFFLQIMFSSAQGFLHCLCFLSSPSVREDLNFCLPQVTSETEVSMRKDEDLDEDEDELARDEILDPQRRSSDSSAFEMRSLTADMEVDSEGKLEPSYAPVSTSSQRRGSLSLQDVSYQVRGAYLSNLGIYELMGLHVTEEGYKQLQELGKSLVHPGTVPSDETGKKSTVTGTYFHLFKAMVGIGVLALPNAYLHAGYVTATIGLILIAYVSHHCMVLLLKVRENLKETHDKLSFGAIGYICFGERGQKVVDCSMIGVQVGVGIAYLIFIGENLERAFDSAPLTKAEYVVICGLLLAPLCFLKSLKMLIPASLLADFVIIFGLVAIFGYDFREMSDSNSTADSFVLSTFPLFFGTAVFTFEGIGLVIPIKESMAEPDKFEGILKVVMIALTVLFVAFGSLGYLAFGENTHDIITLNLPQNNLVRTVQVMYCLGLFLTYPVAMFPAFQILEDTKWYGNLPRCLGDGTAESRGLKSYLFRFGVIVFTVVLAISIPHFSLFINLIGSVACVALAFILPALFYVNRFGSKMTEFQIKKKHAIVVFGVIGGVVSVAVTIQQFIELA